MLVVDCTLREGEQSAGVAFSSDDRLRIARALEGAGLTQVQAGYPGVSEDDRDLVRLLVDSGLGGAVEAIAMIHVDDWKRHVDAALACGATIVSMQFGISDVRLDRVLKLSRKEALARIVTSVEYAKARGAFVSFTPSDTTRADLAFALEVYRALEAAGADRVRIADSIGIASPRAFRALVGSVREAVSVPIGIHCHNDYGLALANLCVAVESGIDFVDASVLGLGERCGNIPLEEAVLVLEDHYGIDTGIRRDTLFDLCELVAGIAGYAIPSMKPVVGTSAFAHQLDNHVRGVLADPVVYEPYDPMSVGNERRFPVSRLSGPHLLRLKCKELGLGLSDAEFERFVERIRAIAGRVGRELTDAEVIDATHQVGRVPKAIERREPV